MSFGGIIPYMPEGRGGLTWDEIRELHDQRVIARASRDFATADKIRDKLKKAGIVVEDGAQSTTWRKMTRREKEKS